MTTDQKRAALAAMHHRAANRVEAHAIAMFRIAGQRRAMAEQIALLTEGAIDRVYDAFQAEQHEQAKALADKAFADAVAAGKAQ